MTDTTPAGWRTRSSMVLHETPWLQVRVDDALQPDGEPAVYTHIVLPPSVTILAIDDHRRIAVTRQWIYTHGGTQWRLPAGGVDAGETPKQAAQRELREEVGITAANWIPLGVAHGADSTTNHVDHLFVALGPTHSNPPALEGGEADLTVEWMSVTQAMVLAYTGEIPHAGSQVALYRARHEGLI